MMAYNVLLNRFTWYQYYSAANINYTKKEFLPLYFTILVLFVHKS